ncbi:MAG: hypothetical protein Q8M11_03480 [Sulfuritalea sp.]|nr:hypothetical protein [Sulfuritalea sp.]
MGTRFAGMSALQKSPELAAVGLSCATPYLNFFPCHFGGVNICFGLVNTRFGKSEKCSRSTEIRTSPKVLDCAQPKFYYEKSAFVGECDMVICQWINTNGKSPRVTGGYTYKARNPLSARSQIV